MTFRTLPAALLALVLAFAGAPAFSPVAEAQTGERDTTKQRDGQPAAADTAAPSGEGSVSAAPEGESDAAPAATRPRVAMSINVEQDGRASSLGRVVIELLPETAPRHVENFLKLAGQGFYDETAFHRLVPGFILQGGDPLSRTDWRSPRLGTGGPGYTIVSEPGGRPNRGAVVGARQPAEVNPDLASSGSQFFICLADLPSLEGYSVFGNVVEGMEVVDRVARIRNAGAKAGNRVLQRVTMSGVTVMR